MQKSLHINADKCTGCLQCEMACSYEHYGVFNTSKSRIKVFEFHKTGKKVPYTCTQCDEAWCLQACPVDAIRVDLITGAKVFLRTPALVARYAPSLAHSEQSTTYKIRARCKSVIFVAVIQPVQQLAQRKPLHMLMLTGLV